MPRLRAILRSFSNLTNSRSTLIALRISRRLSKGIGRGWNRSRETSKVVALVDITGILRRITRHIVMVTVTLTAIAALIDLDTSLSRCAVSRYLSRVGKKHTTEARGGLHRTANMLVSIAPIFKTRTNQDPKLVGLGQCSQQKKKEGQVTKQQDLTT